MNVSLLSFSFPILFGMTMTLLALYSSVQRADLSSGRKVTRFVGVALAAWASAAIVLGAQGFFKGLPGETAPRIALTAAPLAIAWLSAALWAPLRQLIARIPIDYLIGIQTFRIMGALMITAWAVHLIPAEFALPAGIGDLLVGAFAPGVARGLRMGEARAKVAARWWNYAGIADLIVAVGLGVLTAPGPLNLIRSDVPNLAVVTLPFVLIPTLLVPLALVLHGLTARRLADPEAALRRDTVQVATS